MGKWRLPTSHELFQSQTVSELVLEQFRDLYEERRVLTARLAETDGMGDLEIAKLRERLTDIEEALDEVEPLPSDPLTEYWEHEIAEGREPDLTMMPADVPAEWLKARQKKRRR